jgi:hypothetical protein
LKLTYFAAVKAARFSGPSSVGPLPLSSWALTKRGRRERRYVDFIVRGNDRLAVCVWDDMNREFERQVAFIYDTRKIIRRTIRGP